MFYDVSDEQIKKIMENEAFFLPKCWRGGDFQQEVNLLFSAYQNAIKENCSGRTVSDVSKVCDGVLDAIRDYLNGYPSDAYKQFEKVMSVLKKTPLKIYSKSYGSSGDLLVTDMLYLYRVRKVGFSEVLERASLFHVPYNLRSKVQTCRYSIAGFPSLYLGTSIELCCSELKVKLDQDKYAASLFKLCRDSGKTKVRIWVYEMAIKPQYFLENRNIEERNAYVLWYPLVAASSYIRASKQDPFAAEYIMPQLFMQWIRKNSPDNELYGIRYFSCASRDASEMGFNYVFPASGKQTSEDERFCPILAKAFIIEQPEFLHYGKSPIECEENLRLKRSLESVV